jgi:hypothetical protein
MTGPAEPAPTHIPGRTLLCWAAAGVIGWAPIVAVVAVAAGWTGR